MLVRPRAKDRGRGHQYKQNFMHSGDFYCSLWAVSSFWTLDTKSAVVLRATNASISMSFLGVVVVNNMEHT